LQHNTPDINLLELTEDNIIHFYRKYYSSFCFFANRYLKDPSLVEEIVGDVVIKLWINKDNLRNIRSLKNYFYTCIRNACLDRIRKQANQSKKEEEWHLTPVDGQKTILENIIYTETLRELEEAIESLPPQCRKVIIKLYIEGKSLADTAKEMRLSIFTIKSQRQRGIKLLREQLGPDKLAIGLALLSILKN
jgi:RNA polymerase sigma-70 factor (ECF subfamily)